MSAPAPALLAAPAAAPAPAPVPAPDRAPALAGRWLPASPCGPRCLPPSAARSPGDRLRRCLRAVRRLLLVGAVVAVGALLAPALPVLGARRTARVQTAWATALLAAAGVRVEHHGARPAAGSLVVANHVSWIDVPALATVVPVRLLAKREVRDWPVVGAMAARVGTLFLDRERLHVLPAAVDAVAAALAAGGSVGVFAEGTTRCGRHRGRFRPAALQAAVDAGAPVVPVALRYLDAGGRPDTVAAFVGDDTLGASLLRVAAAPRTVVRVEVLAALDPATAPPGPGRAAPRRALAARCAAAVEGALAPAPARVGVGPHPAAAPGAAAPPATAPPVTGPTDGARAA